VYYDAPNHKHKIKNVFEYPSVYEIMWKNIVQPGWSRMTTSSIHIECWIQKAIHTKSQ